MDTEPQPFTPAALALLDRLPFDPAARGDFEYLTGGLMWPDELPPFGSAEFRVAFAGFVYRYLVAYRASITLGQERAESAGVWRQVVRHAPNWPGLRPERRGEAAALRLQARCLTELEAQFDEGFLTPDLPLN